MNLAERECLGCLYINPPEPLVGPNEEDNKYLSGNTSFVDFWVRQSRLADQLDRRVLQTLIPWFQNEWAFSQVLFIAPLSDERQIRLYEEMGLRFLYRFRPRQSFLDVVLAYLLEADPTGAIPNE